MIPSGNNLLTVDLEVKTQPSKQHMMILNKDRITGTCDKLESVRQAVYKILSTERYKYIIYSWNYGIELEDLFGQPVMFVCPEIERRIKEALKMDDRITKVDSFDFDTNKRGVVSVSFTVHTIFGDLEEEMVVKY
jgi:phage baseplate assembly protein W